MHATPRLLTDIMAATPATRNGATRWPAAVTFTTALMLCAMAQGQAPTDAVEADGPPQTDNQTDSQTDNQAEANSLPTDEAPEAAVPSSRGMGLASPAQTDAAPPTESMAQATTSDADMDDMQARAHFRLGRRLYDEGRFADAAREFEIAYGLSDRGQLLFNVYLSYRDAQQTDKAATALRGYLAAVPDAPGRDHLEARLVALETTVEQERAEAARNRAATDTAERRQLEAEARARAAEDAARPKPSRPFWPWLVVGGGVVSTAAGLVLGGLASADADGLRESCVADPVRVGVAAPLVTGDACSPAVNLDEERSRIQSQALLGDVLWIGGALVAATGLVLAFALPDEEPDPSAPMVTAGCGPTGCRANLRVGF